MGGVRKVEAMSEKRYIVRLSESECASLIELLNRKRVATASAILLKIRYR